MESAVLRFLLPESEVDVSALEYRIDKLERKLAQLEQGGAAASIARVIAPKQEKKQK